MNAATDPAVPEDPTEAARLILRDVSPAFHAMLWLGVWRRDGSPPADAGRAKEMAGRLTRAEALLSGGIAAMLAPLAGSGMYVPSETIKAQRGAAGAALADAIRALGVAGPSPAPDADPLWPEAVRGAEEAAETYLAAAEVALRSAHAADRKRARREAEAALVEIGEVSARIGMVSVNASIEACHAGAAGAGFGVIAGEVRALAARCEALRGAIESGLSRL